MALPELVREHDDRDTFYLNMGPQHPSTHGVLRLRLKLSGERILAAEPLIGYSHRAHEKMAETRNYLQFLPNPSRVDYLSGMIYNIGYCQAMEKILGIEVPPRAEHLRVIACELNRVSSHLLWFGTYLLDLGGITPFLYCFDDREQILDVLDRISGSRLTYCCGRFGGLTTDGDDAFCEAVAAFCARFRARLPEYRRLVTDNVIFRKRTQGVGFMDPSLVESHGATGPIARAMGLARDTRKDEPYGIYDKLQFSVPTRLESDCLARYHVRVEEMEQSIGLVEQALRALPDGPIMAPKVPKRIKPPKGEFYFAVESARGHFGMFIVSDGSETPYRIHLRTPSFSNLSTMAAVLPGCLVSDAVAILGSIDIVLPEIDR